MRDHNVPFYSLTHMIDQALTPLWKVRLRALWGHFLAASVVERGQTEGVLPSVRRSLVTASRQKKTAPKGAASDKPVELAGHRLGRSDFRSRAISRRPRTSS